MTGTAGGSSSEDAGDGRPQAGDSRPAGFAGRGAGRPLLTVIRGDTSAEEIAALTAVLAAVGARRAGPPAAARGAHLSVWASRPSLLRRPLSHGPGAWRASGRPG
jgi:Acyl-CoA carboxylase epsilon subunit